MKRFLFTFVLISLSGMHVFGQTNGKAGALHWALENGFLSISGQGPIPDYNPLLNQPAPWYAYRDQIQRVEIASGVTAVGSYAFYDCSLYGVVLPNTLVSMKDYAFASCVNLKSVDIPNSVKGELGMYAFHRCSGLESVSLSNQLTKIGMYAFAFTNVRQLYVQNGVTEIGGFAFFECPRLLAIELPYTVREIGEGAFYNCIGLLAVAIPEGISTVRHLTFKHCTSLRQVQLPQSLDSIGNEAFESCVLLSRLRLPKRLTQIGTFAFFNCTSLDTITIPGSVQHLSKGAFQGCTALQAVELETGVSHIGYGAFADCSSLVSLKIPETVQEIEPAAFWNNRRLRTVTLQWSQPLAINHSDNIFSTVTCRLAVPKQALPLYRDAVVWQDFVLEGYEYVPSHAQAAEANQVKIFPNPATDRICLQGAEGQSVVVFGAAGQKVYQQPVAAANEWITVDSWAPGVYFIRCGTYEASTLRFVKR